MAYLVFTTTAITFFVLLAYAVEGVLATYLTNIEDAIAESDRLDALAYPNEQN